MIGHEYAAVKQVLVQSSFTFAGTEDNGLPTRSTRTDSWKSPGRQGHLLTGVLTYSLTPDLINIFNLYDFHSLS